MDPSSFNSNRIGNAWRSIDNWRKEKLRNWSIWAPIVTIFILVVGIFLLFHQPKHSPNWGILGSVPSSEAKKVEDTAREVRFSLFVPTKLPFVVRHVRAVLTQRTSIQDLKIQFAGDQTTVVEHVTNITTQTSRLENIEPLKLPHAESAYTGTSMGLPVLTWVHGGVLYSLSVTKSNNSKPVTTKVLLSIYRTMD